MEYVEIVIDFVEYVAVSQTLVQEETLVSREFYRAFTFLRGVSVIQVTSREQCFICFRDVSFSNLCTPLGF